MLERLFHDGEEEAKNWQRPISKMTMSYRTIDSDLKINAVSMRPKSRCDIFVCKGDLRRIRIRQEADCSAPKRPISQVSKQKCQIVAGKPCMLQFLVLSFADLVQLEWSELFACGPVLGVFSVLHFT